MQPLYVAFSGRLDEYTPVELPVGVLDRIVQTGDKSLILEQFILLHAVFGSYLLAQMLLCLVLIVSFHQHGVVTIAVVRKARHIETC